MYNSSRNEVNKCIRKTRSDNINKEITTNVDNPKTLFSTLNNLLGKKTDAMLRHGTGVTHANSFSSYFSEKISKVRRVRDQQVVTFLVQISQEPNLIHSYLSQNLI